MAIRIFGVVWFCGVCLLVWVGFAGCSAIGMSQSAVDGAVGGRVVDARGDSVAGARVALKSAATGVAQTVVSGADGTFLVARVVPGAYEVVITATGFAEATEAVTVALGAVANADARLSVEQVTTILSVDAAPVNIRGSIDFSSV